MRRVLRPCDPLSRQQFVPVAAASKAGSYGSIVPNAGEDIFQEFTLHIALVERRIDPDAFAAADMPQHGRGTIRVVVDHCVRRRDQKRSLRAHGLEARHSSRELCVEIVDECAILRVRAIDSRNVEPQAAVLDGA